MVRHMPSSGRSRLDLTEHNEPQKISAPSRRYFRRDREIQEMLMNFAIRQAQLTNTLAGKRVAQAITQAVGCFIADFRQ